MTTIAHNQISSLNRLVRKGYRIMEKSIFYTPSAYGIFCQGIVVLVGKKGARTYPINCKDETTAMRLYLESVDIN